MPKIIKLGQLPENAIYEITCFKCKTVFQFLRREAYYAEDASRGSGGDLSIACPYCENNCVISADTKPIGYADETWSDK